MRPFQGDGATLIAKKDRDLKSDAQNLEKAMAGWSTDAEVIINILGRATNAERQEIAEMFETLTKKDLKKELQSQTSGDFKRLLVALMTPMDEYLASELRRSLVDIPIHESNVIEILLSSTNEELGLIKAAYKRKFTRHMECELDESLDEDMKMVMEQLMKNEREDTEEVDMKMAEEDAMTLFKDINASADVKINKMMMIEILTKRSSAQLREIMRLYEKKWEGKSFEDTISDKVKGELKEAMMAIVQWAKNKNAWLAECLKSTMRGMGTRDRSLMRLVAVRCEIDMKHIKAEYKKMFNTTLEADIESDTSFNYEKLLLTLIR